jgi:hypothetical protein
MELSLDYSKSTIRKQPGGTPHIRRMYGGGLTQLTLPLGGFFGQNVTAM